MLHRALSIVPLLILAAALALMPSASAQQAANDFFEMQENLAETFPVLRNDDPGAGGPHLDMEGSALAPGSRRSG